MINFREYGETPADPVARISNAEIQQDTSLQAVSFNWLMHHLLPPQDLESKLSGCELLFPDTAFFANDDGSGKTGCVARDIIKTDP